MSLKRPKGPGKETAGSLVVLEHSSKILKGNPHGDPHVRKLGVWLPPQYDAGRTLGDAGRARRFPVLYDLVGFTGAGLAHANWKPFGENVPERAARASTTGASSASSRILSQRLAEAGIRHRCEEFDDDHSDIDYRMDVSLPFLYRALK
mgnify:FL=1